MAQRTVLADDIEGTEGDNVQTYTFSHEGKTYEIDLNDKNAKKMHEAFQFYADHGRVAESTGTRKRRSSGTSRPSSGNTSEDRQWLRDNGFPDIKDRGALSKAMKDALAARKSA